MKSATLRAATRLGLTTSTIGLVTISATGLKSARPSYGSLG